MNIKQCLTVTALSLVAVYAYAGDYNNDQAVERTYTPDMLKIYLDSERSAIRYHNEPPEPHWTDTLKEENAAGQAQQVGIEYGNNYGTTGALRPAAEETFGTVAVYFRTTF